MNLYKKCGKAGAFSSEENKVVEATGGLVITVKGDSFIEETKVGFAEGKLKRRNPPRGRIREVIEETGVKDLEIRDFLMTTYHVFTETIISIENNVLILICSVIMMGH